jgi:hypothetical protein
MEQVQYFICDCELVDFCCLDLSSTHTQSGNIVRRVDDKQKLKLATQVTAKISPSIKNMKPSKLMILVRNSSSDKVKNENRFEYLISNLHQSPRWREE